jgi:hypothetical protein
MYDSVVTKPLSDSNPRNTLSSGPHKATLMAFNVRVYKEEDYLQALWALEDNEAKTDNFYLNAPDPKKSKKAHEKLATLLIALGVSQETVKEGGFKDYDSLLNKRVYMIINSFKNDGGEQISYVEKYAPLPKDTPVTSSKGEIAFPNDGVPW